MTNRPKPKAMTRVMVRDAILAVAKYHHIETDQAASLVAECALDVIAAHSSDEAAAGEGYRISDEFVGRERLAAG